LVDSDFDHHFQLLKVSGQLKQCQPYPYHFTRFFLSCQHQPVTLRTHSPSSSSNSSWKNTTSLLAAILTPKPSKKIQVCILFGSRHHDGVVVIMFTSRRSYSAVAVKTPSRTPFGSSASSPITDTRANRRLPASLPRFAAGEAGRFENTC